MRKNWHTILWFDNNYITPFETLLQFFLATSYNNDVQIRDGELIRYYHEGHQGIIMRVTICRRREKIRAAFDKAVMS